MYNTLRNFWQVVSWPFWLYTHAKVFVLVCTKQVSAMLDMPFLSFMLISQLFDSLCVRYPKQHNTVPSALNLNLNFFCCFYSLGPSVYYLKPKASEVILMSSVLVYTVLQCKCVRVYTHIANCGTIS